MLVVGTNPGSGVEADTKLIKDVLGKFCELYCKKTLTIQFPEVFQQLKGTDTEIEIITSSMLQPLRMGIRGYKVEDVSVYIFVQTHLQRAELTAKQYVNAELRAEETMKLFRDDFKIAPQNIKICKNWSKEKILSLCDHIDQDASKFG